MDYVREYALENELLFGAYHNGVLLLTHPERVQVWDQLHIDCVGDEYAPRGSVRQRAPLRLVQRQVALRLLLDRSCQRSVWFGVGVSSAGLSLERLKD